MKAITKLLASIETQRASISQLQSDYDAAERASGSVTVHASDLESLRAQRRTLLAEALATKKPANTASIDAKIKNTEQQHFAAQTASANAGDQLEIVREGISIAETELASLIEKLGAAVTAEMMSRYEAALEAYLKTVEVLGREVGALVAINRAWNHIDDSVGVGGFTGKSQLILEGIQRNGIRVPWNGSRLADPAVAAGYTDNFKSFLYAPVWADPKTLGFADDQAVTLVAELRAAGLPVHDINIKKAAVKKQVKVRVVRGAVELSTVIRDPETEEVVSRPARNYMPGDDVMIDEIDALNLKLSGHVLIHGEDKMPEPPPPVSAVKRVEAFRQQSDVYLGSEEIGSRGDSYTGFNIPLDLGAY